MMKVKKNDIIDLWSATEGLLKEENSPAKFRYFIIKNRKIIGSEIDALTALVTPDPEYQEYETKRISLATELSDKDAQGKPKIDGKNFVIETHKEKFAESMASLKESYKDQIAVFQSKIDKYNSELDVEIDFDGYKIKIDEVPDYVTTPVIELFDKLNLIM